MSIRWVWAALLAGLAAGCGGPAADGLVPAAGAVTADGGPVAGAVVTFIPQGDTKGGGGSGTTDAAGRYQLAGPRGEKGVPAGRYKVTVSRPRNPDGSAPDPNVPPIDSQARETVPARYSDPGKTELAVTVEAGRPDHDLKLTGVKK